MPNENLRSLSKTQWFHEYQIAPGLEAVNCGSLLRIADSLEVVQRSYTTLLDQIRYQREDIESLRKCNNKLERRVRGLRGALTRSRKK